MATEERNFRSYYYDKVGFRGVEEKKSIEILLKDTPLSTVKLSQFMIRFPMPGIYRSHVWKILLGVVPLYQSNDEFVQKQQRQVYEDLKHGIAFVHSNIYPHLTKAQLMLLMWLLEEKQLKYYDIGAELQEPMHKHFICVIEAMSEFSDNEYDVFWMSKKFMKLIQKNEDNLDKMVLEALNLLKKEDSALYQHLQELHVLTSIPIEVWLRRAFAGIFSPLVLERIWDKLIGGCHIILSFAAAALLIASRRILLSSKTSEKVLDCISNVTEEVAELAVGEAIEMWQRHGSPMNLSSQDTNRTAHH